MEVSEKDGLQSSVAIYTVIKPWQTREILKGRSISAESIKYSDPLAWLYAL